MNQTENYIWNTQDFVGDGATGEVYKGYEKKTGETVAVKVARRKNQPGFDRELDVLGRFHHPNIVQLRAIEKLHRGGPSVVVMEFCNGGSLQKLLSEPGNVFGFEDQEFLTVLHDIAAGMEKLRVEKVIHRDIKPGNIMRCIGLDGKTVFKLIDFDTARELSDEGEFQSMCGTPEYLHPMMYDRCFMGSNTSQFPHHVDLWSIGVTLYHVAAGQLPFQPFRMRNDKVTMSKIINGRSDEVISGVQRKDHGTIEYSQHLPNNIVMSPGLRPHVEKIIALLFNKKTSFDQFFDEAKAIASLRRVTTFHYASTEVLNIYLPPNTTYESFQDIVEKTTSIPAALQLLILQNLPFSTQFCAKSGHLVVKEISRTDPVYLFSCHSDMPRSTGLHNRTFNFPPLNVKLDDHLWQPILESMHYMLRAVTAVVERQGAITKGSKMLIQYITRKFDRLESLKCHVVDLLQSHFSKLESVQLLVSFVHSSHQSEASKSGLEEYNKHIRSAKKIERRLAELSSQLQATLNQLQQLVDFWALEKPSCRPEDCCVSQIKAWIREVEEMKMGMKDRVSKDEENLTKEKLRRALKTAKDLVEGHCQPNARSLYEEFCKFMSSAWKVEEDLNRYEEDLHKSMDVLKTLADEEIKADSDRRRNLGIPSTLPSTSTPITPSPILNKNPIASLIGNRTSHEGEFMRQLLSVVSEKKSVLLREMLPLARENQKMSQHISRTLEDLMSNAKIKE